uniref:Uncharacterized protein n=1 Tax=Anguilla anguilla TaxID=7936 RepID=A0A0E9W470_ANGAN
MKCYLSPCCCCCVPCHIFKKIVPCVCQKKKEKRFTVKAVFTVFLYVASLSEECLFF